MEAVASLAGALASLCFTVQYFPQAMLNFQRRSTKGFSQLSVAVKLCGAAFLLANAVIVGEAAALVVYGVLNVTQHLVFVGQFAA